MYALQSMGMDQFDASATTLDNPHNVADDHRMQQRWKLVKDSWEEYKSVMEKTGFGSKLGETERWIRATKLEESPSVQESIVHREEFFRGHGKMIIERGVPLYAKFFKEMERGKGAISKDSYNRWVSDRFYNDNISFLEKKYWIENQMTSFVTGWIKVAEEYDTLAKDPHFKEIIGHSPSLTVMNNREKFLDLHYDQRTGLMAEARAVKYATKKNQMALFAEARERLTNAKNEGYLADNKVGVWLERMMKSNADPKKIEEFVRGTGGSSLGSLMNKWYDVKRRYDVIAEKFTAQSQQELPRGIHLDSPSQFLNLHYTQRLRYVEEMENRLGQSRDLSHEPDSFVEIRYAIDSKDWAEAEHLIAKMQDEPMSDDAKTRLKSMKRYVTQFSANKIKADISEPALAHAKERVDYLLTQMGHSHSEVKPLAEELLESEDPNRAFHQWRWTQYNNDWCRTHGPPYLDDQKARDSASDDHTAMTKYRSEHGMDTGLRDNLDYETAAKEYVRKKKFSSHKATLMSVNLKSGAVVSVLGEILKKPQTSKWCYWNTLNWHSDGDPKPANWNKDLLLILTELRAHTRTFKNAGKKYAGPNEKELQKM